ncbi:tRNA (guanosine(46)-N7)-methyltransferase TrmB [Enterobacteriaceae endosymbiont of Donacia clavipes]|uniref:tRNA (guanosine(46)-N7)-methyltransferase TrmB n=1 Tax=Enterobacteriaceae endosymbiont of Donacia clavipes TaxID=2675775 RepID=UPI0014498583|nr:tRNA (guanosine(46)-N7)-methyltransferase TrmB [Enterobacteriaceae endosymbiont of Donacia clavipes]QJC33353.1 tRNA (guanosine(46)-N7)-methyltransferase TrmB [Enterobacteriaceae endosymbiont of Donacia clavipes]
MNNIKSFVCRYRKLTKFNNIFFSKYFNFFNIKKQNKIINFQYYFHNKLPIIFDIGFGIGNNIINLAINNVQYNFIAVEVYLPGIINCLKYIIKNNIKNLRLIYCDVFFVFKYMIPNNSIKLIQLYFPDPWPKLKHKKRRLLKINFIQILFNKLENNGLLYIVTDCKNYYLDIISCIENFKYKNQFFIFKSNKYKNIYKNFNPLFLNTKFLNKAKIKKKIIYYIEYEKISIF